MKLSISKKIYNFDNGRAIAAKQGDQFILSYDNKTAVINSFKELLNFYGKYLMVKA